MKLKIFLLLLIILFSIFYPGITGFKPDSFDLENQYLAPSFSHPAGTDIKGLDMLSKIAFSIRLSVLIALLATLISFIIGIFYGTLSGYFGGKTDNIMMRFIDILYGLPFTLLVIVLMTVFGRNIFLLFIALGLVQWLTIARIIRGETLSIKKELFIDYAVISGTGSFSIITKHIFPNILNIAITYMTLLIPTVILEESFISYLGLGVKPPNISLGSLISEGFKCINPVGFYWWLFFIPIFVLIIIVFLFFSIGNELKAKYEK